MATELEQEFYKVFEIEPNSKWHKCKDYNCICCDEYEFCSKREFDYPKITDSTLLEMICICNSTYINGYTNYFISTGKTKEELKEEILGKCITLSKDIKNQIQQLFKEE